MGITFLSVFGSFMAAELPLALICTSLVSNEAVQHCLCYWISLLFLWWIASSGQRQGISLRRWMTLLKSGHKDPKPLCSLWDFGTVPRYLWLHLSMQVGIRPGGCHQWQMSSFELLGRISGTQMPLLKIICMPQWCDLEPSTTSSSVVCRGLWKDQVSYFPPERAAQVALLGRWA